MLKRIILAGALLLLLNVSALAAETAYSGVIEDLPLMTGMTEKAADAVIFDKPGGRIVETEAETSSPMEEIERFYTETLPPLGWKKLAPTSFVRDNEKLVLSLERKGTIILVHFTLTPAAKGG
jgi:hypothetical protein